VIIIEHVIKRGALTPLLRKTSVSAAKITIPLKRTIALQKFIIPTGEWGFVGMICWIGDRNLQQLG
jgi:hypothetical protein